MHLKLKDLASRDVVSRSIATEINEGRGVGKEKSCISSLKPLRSKSN